MSAFDELVAHPGVGRRFQRAVMAGLADAAPGGRVRLDALARWLQDAALEDVVDAGLGETALWVVRRTRLAVTRFPRFGEAATVRTWASGVGRMWAQRRTTITTAEGGRIEAVALWVHLDPDGGRPTPLTAQELEVYGPSTAGREIKARLRHPGPPEGAAARPWTFRRTEADVADHINNAAYWAPLEEELLARDAEPAALDVELEYRTPGQPGPHTVIADGTHRWVVDDGAGDVRASFRLAGLDGEG
ncbi:MAG TPA: acyl-ACP thioesterase domain-containing protein [Baekduia sp.]|nr:acyl-ACP thioesterase domain-containing protein [Baekduia sp.]